MLGSLIWLVLVVTNIYFYMLLAKVVLSWLMLSRRIDSQYRYHPVVQFIDRATEPVVAPIRRQLSKYDTGPFDFSVMIAMFLVQIAQKIIIQILYAAGAH